MTPLDLLQILALVFYLGSSDGRVGLDAPPAQATEMWIANSETTQAAVWITEDGVSYTTEGKR